MCFHEPIGRGFVGNRAIALPNRRPKFPARFHRVAVRLPKGVGQIDPLWGSQSWPQAPFKTAGAG
jgi:hypothetical protein